LNKTVDSLPEEMKVIEEISGYNLYKIIKIVEGGSTEVFYLVEKNFKYEVAIKFQKKNFFVNLWH